MTLQMYQYTKGVCSFIVNCVGFFFNDIFANSADPDQTLIGVSMFEYILFF